jgi:uncharacterized protein
MARIPAGMRGFDFSMVRHISHRILRAAVFAALISGSMVPSVHAAAIERPEDVPNPLATAGKYVGDGAGVLGPAYVDLINDVCVRLKNATGSELSVITVRDLGGTAAEDFSARLFKRLGIGEKGKDNGLLLLLALDDRAVRFEVGYGLEPVVPDALAGRLLDEQAMPFLSRGEYGRGLFAATKAVAETIAKTAGTSMGLSDPTAWPNQVPPTSAAPGKSQAHSSRSHGGNPESRAASRISLVLAAVVIIATGLWALFAFRRFGRARSKADRITAANLGYAFIGLVWTGAVIAVIILLAMGGRFPPILALCLSPFAANALWIVARRGMRVRAAHYHLCCRACGSPMNLVPEDQDDALLSVEEAAEEKAGGMDYELWDCPSCGAKERFAVKLGKAKPCPVCGRRTLVRDLEILVAATASHGGTERVTDECKNPKCGYSKTWERATPRIASPSSGSGSGRSGFSSSSGSHSSSSFGGGRSGGGGATRHF